MIAASPNEGERGCFPKDIKDTAGTLLAIYERLNDYFGDLHWWPGSTPFEVIVGAILTQNTAWRNVELAIANLKGRGILSVTGLFATPEDIIASLIRPSGYYNVKTNRLKSFVYFLKEEYKGNLETMFAENLPTLRDKLLSVKGIGEETADSILLYAADKPVFVVDAYTKRILHRHGFITEDSDYAEIQNLFMDNLAVDVPFFNQYHALLVNTGKKFCRKKPLCREGCPLYQVC
jgi:endonuclease-3 related protein